MKKPDDLYYGSVAKVMNGQQIGITFLKASGAQNALGLKQRLYVKIY